MAIDQEYLTGNRKIRYPFAEDTVLSTEDSMALLVFGCFIDAFIQPKSLSADIDPYISGISMDGGVLSFSLHGTVGGEDVSVPLTCSSSRLDRFPIVNGQTEWCWFTFVMSSAGISEYADAQASDKPVGDISGDVVRFSKRCLGYYSSMEVTSLRVYGGERMNEAAGRRYTRREVMELEEAGVDVCDAVLDGHVTFKTGYNMSFSPGLADLDLLGEQNTGDITFNASPGAGLGRLPCRCVDTLVYKTPGLLSKDGHTRLFNDTCYDLVPRLFSAKSSELMMHVKCKACCTCEMYEDVVNKRLAPLKDSILESRDTLDEVLDTYTENVKKWNKRLKTATPDDIVVTVSAVPLDAAATDLTGTRNVSGKMNRCGFSVMVRNESFVMVDVSFDGVISNGEVFESQLSYMDSSKTPVIVPAPSGVARVTLPPGRSVTLTCFIRLNSMVKTDRQTGFAARASVTVRQDGRVVLATEKGVSL